MKKGFMIKVLQAATVFQFFAFCVAGILVFALAPEKMDAFGKLVDIIFPLFVSEVVPALIGTPLTEAVRNLTEKKDQPVN